MIYSTHQTTRAVPVRRIVVSTKLWLDTWLGLRQRGGGRVESAAVWGGRRDVLGEVVEGVYFLDDLPGGLQRSAFHRVSSRATAELFSDLQRDRRLIVADIHTHPTGWVGLSGLDQANPIEFRNGLYALVLPSYGIPSPSLAIAGVHEYLGKGKWRELSQSQKRTAFVFTPSS